MLLQIEVSTTVYSENDTPYLVPLTWWNCYIFSI